MSEKVEYFAENDTPERLDCYLATVMEDVSRSRIKSWCKAGRVFADGKVAKASLMVMPGMQLEINLDGTEVPDHIVPEDLPLDVVHEDEHIVVINKFAGMVVHPGAGIYSGTLVNALAFHFGQLTERGGSMRPGIVHRLDKGTSGLILVAKTDLAHKELTRQWQEGGVTKVYKALVWGIPQPPEGEVISHIGRHPRFRHMMTAEMEGGRWSKSRYKVTATFPEAAALNVHILTGRTHQIRVHMAHLGHPVVGDALYGRNRHKSLEQAFTAMPDHPMLHAALLRFHHPATGALCTFKQLPPQDFEACARALSTWPT